MYLAPVHVTTFTEIGNEDMEMVVTGSPFPGPDSRGGLEPRIVDRGTVLKYTYA